MTAALRLVAYLRVSTDDKGQDPERQRPHLEAHATQGGHQIVAWVIDDGVSAGENAMPTLDRPGVEQALQRAGELKANGILVENVDRWTRKGSMDLGYSMFVLHRDYGLKLVFADLPQDEFAREVLPPLMATMARLDNKRRSDSTRSGMARKKSLGVRMGRPLKPGLTDAEWPVVLEMLRAGKGTRRASLEVSRLRGAFELTDPKARKERGVSKFWLECQLALNRDKTLGVLSRSPSPSRLKAVQNLLPGLDGSIESQESGAKALLPQPAPSQPSMTVPAPAEPKQVPARFASVTDTEPRLGGPCGCPGCHDAFTRSQP